MAEEHILHSDCDKLISLEDEPTVPAYVVRKLREHKQSGRNTCITNPTTGESFSYTEVDKLSENLASSLFALGFRKGDTLIYCSHDGANLHIFFIGVWRANGILRSSYPEDLEDELLQRIVESNARWILCDQQQSNICLKTSKMAAWNVQVIVFGKTPGCISATELCKDCGNGGPAPALSLSQNDIAIVLPTSGTTGCSKGAIFTHATIVRILLVLETIPIIDDLIGQILLVGKQTHFTGSLLALSCITAGRNLLMLSTISMKNITNAIKTYKPRSLFLFPKFLMELVQNNNCDLSSIQHVATGGVIVGPSLINAVKTLPNFQYFIVLYGMTECGLLSTNINWKINGQLIENVIKDLPAFSCGRLVPKTSLIVRDIQTGKSLGPGQTGELYFKSQLLCDGYLCRPKETAETFENGWIRTGDLGYYDEKRYIYVVDRLKETFKYYNNHICPSELENIIVEHSAVAEACVIGVKDPDGGDTIPRAFVVLKKEFRTTLAVSGIAEDIMKYANNLLASYKHLRGGLFILSKLPQGNTGKVTRRALATLSPAQLL